MANKGMQAGTSKPWAKETVWCKNTLKEVTIKDIKPYYFCKKCHERINTPNVFRTGNIKVKGSLKLNCSKCKAIFVEIKGDEHGQ